MIKIMFVCHGNICRSPMAEFIMKDMLLKENLESSVYVESRATSTEETGNPVYPPAKAELARHGIKCGGKYAQTLRPEDYDDFDLFALMDGSNLRNIKRIFPDDPQGKIHKLLEFAGRNGDISDPWYTGRFDTAYSDIYDGCKGLMKYIRSNIT
ncbi:MAG: low molecular weight phosphotyrosine protein phosphatase [Ruminococcus sp.]|nr:low molecular weight phosphotyrosine protein phosphatase [Ruminococcus sp.]